MKHVFIVNPTAGKGEKYKSYINLISSVCSKSGKDYLIHTSTGVGEATVFVDSFAASHKNDLIRFYAAGGDGTLCETAAGCIGHENCELAVIPIGTGNDFVRNFTDISAFLDIKRQLSGSAVKIDAVKYCDRCFVNMFNVGFDCAVVSKAGELKHNPLILSGMAYTAGVAVTLARKPTVKAKLTFGNGEIMEQEALLMTVANGSYYGGGYKSSPKADLCDGLLDVLIAKNVTRREFVSMIGDYKKGVHLDKPYANDIMITRRTDALSADFGKAIPVCIDGELEMREGVEMRVIPGALKLSIPQGSEMAGGRHAEKPETKTATR